MFICGVSYVIKKATIISGAEIYIIGSSDRQINHKEAHADVYNYRCVVVMS